MQRWVRVIGEGIVDIGTLPKEYRANDGSLLLDSGAKEQLKLLGFYSYEDTPPEYDANQQYLAAAFEFDGENVTRKYVVVDFDIDRLKEYKTREIANARWVAETGGVNGIRTDRESQAMITGAALAAMQDDTYTCQWKGEAGFVTLTAAQILATANAVRQHVQACFDQESDLSALITAAETVADLEVITWG